MTATKDEAFAIKSLRSLFERFPQSYHHLLFTNSAGALAAITLQRNPKKEFASWDTKETTRVIHFGRELQYRQN